MPMALSKTEQAYLNKIYRAVHDGVCPSCGADLMPVGEGYTECPFCNFSIHDREMVAMRKVIKEWGKDAVNFFKTWRLSVKDD